MTRTLAIIALCASCMAQAQHAPRIDWQQAVDLSARTLDTISTRQMLNRGGTEYFLPDAITDHAATMEAYGIGVVVAESWLTRKWIAPKHPRIARWVPLVDAGATLPWALHNFSVAGRKEAVMPTCCQIKRK